MKFSWSSPLLEFCLQYHKGSTSDPILDKDGVLRQWSEAKTIVKEARYPVDNMEALLGWLIKHHAEDIPELIKLALIALVLILYTAGCMEWSVILFQKYRRTLYHGHGWNFLGE